MARRSPAHRSRARGGTRRHRQRLWQTVRRILNVLPPSRVRMTTSLHRPNALLVLIPERTTPSGSRDERQRKAEGRGLHVRQLGEIVPPSDETKMPLRCCTHMRSRRTTLREAMDVLRIRLVRLLDRHTGAHAVAALCPGFTAVRRQMPPVETACTSEFVIDTDGGTPGGATARPHCAMDDPTASARTASSAIVRRTETARQRPAPAAGLVRATRDERPYAIVLHGRLPHISSSSWSSGFR